jgi:hypothetical protein
MRQPEGFLATRPIGDKRRLGKGLSDLQVDLELISRARE